MLVQFSVTNFRNFRDTATLDLSEAKITEFPEHLYRSSDGLGVLPMAALYGPNGSGKSNFLKAIWYLRSLVLEGTSHREDFPCFCFDDECRRSPVEFDMLFRIGEDEYEYQLKLLQNSVLEENLFGRSLDDDSFDVLFDRDQDGVFLCEAWEHTDVSLLSDETPLLYFLGTRVKDSQIHAVLTYFRNMIFFSSDAPDITYIEEVLQTADLKESLVSHLKTLCPDIADIRETSKTVILTHINSGNSVQLPWKEESTGTRQLISLLSCMLCAKKQKALLLADDPEIHLHPKVLGYLYRLASASDNQTEGAQLLTATHENSNMNNRIFRRDEIWLTAREEDGSSSLYILALFLKENGEKVRKDETYFKQYLEGRYGADPSDGTW